MDNSPKDMDKTTADGFKVYREERFRVPAPVERTLGLWVDRIGRATTTEHPGRLRILGQYCHIFVLEGSGVYLSKAAGKWAVSAGDCMLQFPEDPCMYYPRGEWTTCWVTWNGAEGKVLENLGYMNPLQPVFPDPDGTPLQAASKLSPILLNEDPASALKRKSILLDMVHQAHTAANFAASPLPRYTTMEKIVEIIHDRYKENLKIPELAEEVHLSVSHFRRCFREYTGRTPTEFIRGLRIAEAKRLLLEQQPIKQVASGVGYKDVFYFMRVFKNTTGLPPGKFRDR